MNKQILITCALLFAAQHVCAMRAPVRTKHRPSLPLTQSAAVRILRPVPHRNYFNWKSVDDHFDRTIAEYRQKANEYHKRAHQNSKYAQACEELANLELEKCKLIKLKLKLAFEKLAERRKFEASLPAPPPPPPGAKYKWVALPPHSLVDNSKLGIQIRQNEMQQKALLEELSKNEKH